MSNQEFLDWWALYAREAQLRELDQMRKRR